jgi:hypothetical protein
VAGKLAVWAQKDSTIEQTKGRRPTVGLSNPILRDDRQDETSSEHLNKLVQLGICGSSFEINRLILAICLCGVV